MSVIDLDTRTIEDTIAVLTGESDNRIRTHAAGRVDYSLSAREAWSYGRHFPLFRFVPGSRRRKPLFVINGDVWNNGGGPSRTRDHQAAARAAIAETGLDSVILPFSALNGAGIDIDTIRPIHVRADKTWTETREAKTLSEVPSWTRTESYHETRTAETLEKVPPNHRRDWTSGQYRDIEPDPETGLYSWQEWARRDKSPDADGIYRWEVTIHRLGDALFSGVRSISEPVRPAKPFEHESETARRVVQLRDDNGRTYCTGPDSDIHEAGPSGECVYCGSPLRADVTRRRRARYLSSFDLNESPALYFLCEVPRGAGDTVETALGALAPRAVHAAIARGRRVERQGDVFFIETDLSREDLAGRGAVFGRLTQFTRDAKARRGEIGFKPNPTAAERRRELSYARKRFREIFRGAVSSAVERGAAFPKTEKNARARFRKIRESHELDLAIENRRLRAAIFGRVSSGQMRYVSVPYHRPGNPAREAVRRNVVDARGRLDWQLKNGGRDSLGRKTRAQARDHYRARYGGNATGAWLQAKHEASEKYRPGDIAGTDHYRKQRESVRKLVAIYGTAHSGTEVARVNGAVYVSGTVRHVPELDPNRGGTPDHAPVTLDSGKWYLCVRNTVPRAR